MFLFRTYNIGDIYFEWFEFILIPFLLTSIFVASYFVKQKNISKNSAYKYFQYGLFFKIGFGIAFGLIYVFYYGGGDTTSYYASSVPLARLFWESPMEYFELVFNTNYNPQLQEWHVYISNFFSSETGLPYGGFSGDSKTFMVCKLISPLLIVTGESYFSTTILVSTILFFPIWKLFIIFRNERPDLEFKFAIAFLFIPSVAFWGSGIMKDSFTFSATLLFVNSFYLLLLKRKWNNIVGILTASFIIITIKPYIFIILLPCIGLWAYSVYSNEIRSPIIKFIAMPFLFVVLIGGSIGFLQYLGSSMDKFALDKALETTIITQEDFLNNKNYGDNKFDIGKLDGTLPNLLSKVPIATFSGLYRPSLLEVRNPVSLLSAFENTFFLFLLIKTLYTLKLSRIIRIVMGNSILVFSVMFIFLFAFMIGVTTPNFGALVRFKIPLIPFYVSLLYILISKKISNIISTK